MTNVTVLLIDTKRDARLATTALLESAGFSVLQTEDGSAAVELVRAHAPGAVVLDLQLPIIDAFQVCARIRMDRRTSSTPILVLCDHVSGADRVMALEMGADDVMSKPHAAPELAARLRMILRRHRTDLSSQSLQWGPIRIDMTRRTVACGDQKVTLSDTEFRLLYHLVDQRGRVCSRDDIARSVLGIDPGHQGRTVDMHIMSIRKKLGAWRGELETVRAVGYRLREPPASVSAA